MTEPAELNTQPHDGSQEPEKPIPLDWILANTVDFHEFHLGTLRDPEELQAYLSVCLEDFEEEGEKDIELLKLGIRTAIEALERYKPAATTEGGRP